MQSFECSSKGHGRCFAPACDCYCHRRAVVEHIADMVERTSHRYWTDLETRELHVEPIPAPVSHTKAQTDAMLWALDRIFRV